MSTKLFEYIVDPENDQLATFRYDLKHLTSLTSVPNVEFNEAKFYSASGLFNYRTFSTRVMALELQMSIKHHKIASKFICLHFKAIYTVCAFFLIREWSSDKVSVTVSKYGVYFSHVIRCFYLHHTVFC